MSKQEFINHTKQFLIDYYRYSENLIETNADVSLSDGMISLDLLIKDREGKSVGFILTDNELRTRKEFFVQLKEILSKSNLTYGVFRYQTQDDIPGFIGLVKENSLLTDNITYKELVDYPRPDISWPELLFNLIPYLD